MQPVGASSRTALLVHGDIGTGKTSLIGTAAEAGIPTLIMRPPIDHTDSIVGSGAQEMIVRNWEDIFEGLDQVYQDPEVVNFLGDNGWFWMDSISLLQDVGLDDVYEGVLDQKGPIGSEARKYRERFGPDKGEYRVNMWRLAQWVRKAVSLQQFNVGITAHSFWYEPEGAEHAYLAPWVQGRAMPERICGMMNMVGYLEVAKRTVRGNEREVRVIRWNKTETYYAKNQYKQPSGESIFPTGELVAPTMPKIVDAVKTGRLQASRRRRAATAGTVTPIRRRRAKGAQ